MVTTYNETLVSGSGKEQYVEGDASGNGLMFQIKESANGGNYC